LRVDMRQLVYNLESARSHKKFLWKWELISSGKHKERAWS
jgi:hypothetical protein